MPLTNIQILRSAVPYKRPDPNFLLDGQLAVNYKSEEPGLFTKLQDGGIVKFGPTAITNNGDAPNANPDVDGEPGNSLAEKWFDDRPAFYSGVERIWDGANWRLVSGFEIDDLTGDMTLLRTLNITHLNTDTADVNGLLRVNGNVLPFGTTCVHDMGLAAERWNGIFGCSLDILNDGQIGNDLVVIGNGTVGGNAAVDGNINVNGGDNTFGQSCADTAFTIESPAFLNCDTSIIGDITAGGALTMAGDLTVDGSIQLGSGCGITTLNVTADTTFNCPVNFAGTAFVFGDGCLTSTIEFNGATQFNCDSLPNVGSSIDIGSPAATFRAMYADNFEGGAFNGDSLTLTGKGQSASTVAGDLGTTLTTKDYVDGEIANAVDASQFWNRAGTQISPRNAGDSVLPNGAGTLGSAGSRWDTVFADAYFATTYDGASLALTAKGTSATTVAADPPTTLTTKNFVEQTIADEILAAALWERVNGNQVRPVTANDNIIPNGTTSIGEDLLRFSAVYANNLFTNDLHLKNERGDWTMIEEEDCLTIRNNKTGKRYAISMTPYNP